MTHPLHEAAEPGAAVTVHASGSPAAIGRALGRAGREATHRILLPSRAWAAARAWVDTDRQAALEAATRRHFPDVWEEITGLAKGLSLPLAEVFAWVCRGDLPGVLWPAPPDAGAEGCTTVARRIGVDGGILAHNEDGDPALAAAVFLARIAPDDGAPAFTTFCYPGSLAGHAFAWSDIGLVQTINNIRVTAPGWGVPRIVRARAVLTAGTLAEARAILAEGPAAGAFHHLLARPGEGLVGVEVTPAGVVADPGRACLVHANHALWSGPVGQVVTDSSAARQARAEALATAWPETPTEADLGAVLNDRTHPRLPIRRTDPADPDGEITLGRLVARVRADGAACRAVLFKPG